MHAGKIKKTVNQKALSAVSGGVKRKPSCVDCTDVNYESSKLNVSPRSSVAHRAKKASRNNSKHEHYRTQTSSIHRYSDDVWFDDIPSVLIAASKEDQTSTGQSLVKQFSFSGCTKRIAIDCEFVGVGYEGKENALARVSIVNQFGHVLLDAYVHPNERVMDYRTAVSGIRPSDLKIGGKARPFREVHREVVKLCKGRVLVGHSIGNDLKVLMLSHPRNDIRDTSRYRPFRALFSGKTPSLRDLTQRVLGIRVQQGEHDSVEDARAAMRLYTSVKRVWESARGGRSSSTSKILPAVKDIPKEGQYDPLNTKKRKIRRPGVGNISEYESGLEPLNTSPSQMVTPLGPRIGSCRQSSLFTRALAPISATERNNSARWDDSRNRRCSRKRIRFVKRRQQQRARCAGRSQLQSASLV